MEAAYPIDSKPSSGREHGQMIWNMMNQGIEEVACIQQSIVKERKKWRENGRRKVEKGKRGSGRSAFFRRNRWVEGLESLKEKARVRGIFIAHPYANAFILAITDEFPSSGTDLFERDTGLSLFFFIYIYRKRNTLHSASHRADQVVCVVWSCFSKNWTLFPFLECQIF